MGRVLVEFFSDYGNTRKAAEDFVAACQADLEEIEEFKEAEGSMGMVKDIMLDEGDALPKVKPPRKPVSEYDVVVVGVPVNKGHASTSVEAFLKAYGHDMRNIAFLGVGDGAHAPELYRDLATLAGKEPVAALGLRDDALEGADYRRRLEDFAERVAQLH